MNGQTLGKRRPAVIRWADMFREADKRVKALEKEIADRDDQIFRLKEQLKAEQGLVAALEKMSYRPNQLACYVERLAKARRILAAINEWAKTPKSKKKAA